jgi:predicted enzyme related to lactoylglutathione lyase
MPQPYPHGELVIVIDCADLDRSAAFWSAALGYTASAAATGPYRSLEPESGAGSILADPDGNEFCVLQPPGIPSA